MKKINIVYALYYRLSDIEKNVPAEVTSLSNSAVYAGSTIAGELRFVADNREEQQLIQDVQSGSK